MPYEMAYFKPQRHFFQMFITPHSPAPIKTQQKTTTRKQQQKTEKIMK